MIAKDEKIINDLYKQKREQLKKISKYKQVTDEFIYNKYDIVKNQDKIFIYLNVFKSKKFLDIGMNSKYMVRIKVDFGKIINIPEIKNKKIIQRIKTLDMDFDVLHMFFKTYISEKKSFPILSEIYEKCNSSQYKVGSLIGRLKFDLSTFRSFMAFLKPFLQ